MRIGPRVWKTALAVTVSVALGRALGLEHPVFAAIAAIICMQPTITASIKKGVERMQATMVGAAFSLLALLAMQAFPPLETIRPAVIGLTVLAVMVVTIRLAWLDSLVLATATVVIVMALPAEENIYRYSAGRTLLTFIGIVIATIVNALFASPRYSGMLMPRISELAGSTSGLYRQAVEAFCFRRADLAGTASEALAADEQLLEQVTTNVQRMKEDARLRKYMRWPPESGMETVERMVDLLADIRRSTATILRLTLDMLCRKPEYADHHAQVYDVLLRLAQIGFDIFDHVERKLASGRIYGEPGDVRTWDDEVHRQLVLGIRAGYRAPRDIFPLVEVAMVAFEIRQVTENLAELDKCISTRPTPPGMSQ